MRQVLPKILVYDSGAALLKTFRDSRPDLGLFIALAKDEEDVWKNLALNNFDIFLIEAKFCVNYSCSFIPLIKKRYPGVVILLLAPKRDKISTEMLHQFGADGVVEIPPHNGVELKNAVDEYISKNHMFSGNALKPILETLKDASTMVLEKTHPEVFIHVAFDAMADVCNAPAVAILFRAGGDKQYQAISQQNWLDKYHTILTESAAHGPKIFILDDSPGQPKALNKRLAVRGGAFVVVPVNRPPHEYIFAAARFELPTPFTEIEQFALHIIAHQIALILETPAYQSLLIGESNLEPDFNRDPANTTGRMHNGKYAVKEARLNYRGSAAAPIFFPSADEGIEVIFDERKRLVSGGGVMVHLTLTETRLFAILWKNQDELLQHVDLVKMTHGYQVNIDEASKILRPVISRLKKKLSVFPGGEDWIKNIRGAGYILGRY